MGRNEYIYRYTFMIYYSLLKLKVIFKIFSYSGLPSTFFFFQKEKQEEQKNDPDPIPDPDQDQDLGLADHDQNLMNVQEKDPTKREKRKDEGNPEVSPELQIMKPKTTIT